MHAHRATAPATWAFGAESHPARHPGSPAGPFAPPPSRAQCPASRGQCAQQCAGRAPLDRWARPQTPGPGVRGSVLSPLSLSESSQKSNHSGCNQLGAGNRADGCSVLAVSIACIPHALEPGVDRFGRTSCLEPRSAARACHGPAVEGHGSSAPASLYRATEQSPAGS